MTTKNDRRFCAFILTHGRPDKVYTLATLKRSGYTGDIVLVLDTEDTQRGKYEENFPELHIEVIDKAEEGAFFDTGDLRSAKRNVIVYARNACFRLARKLGYTHFVQLDDDYTNFSHAGLYDMNICEIYIRNLNRVFELFCELLDSTNVKTVCLAQGGDFIGGQTSPTWHSLVNRRKAMNSFVCRVDRPFHFLGRVNEDVTTYVLGGTRGDIFLTIPCVRITQMQTQSSAGGMTENYLEGGTFQKSWYSVMFSPSNVKIGVIRDTYARIHHSINWRNITPKILRQKWASGVR